MKTEKKTVYNRHGKIEYQEKKSSRAKRVCLTISEDGTVTASRPWWVSSKQVESFVKSKASWILEKLAVFDNVRSNPLLKTDRATYLEHKEPAREFITARVAELNQYYQFAYKRIAIRNQRTVWGSCSKKQNLNFNYKLIFMPPEIVDYVIVHELCHLKELNHSKKFWNLVALAIPDYKERKKELRNLTSIK